RSGRGRGGSGVRSAVEASPASRTKVAGTRTTGWRAPARRAPAALFAGRPPGALRSPPRLSRVQLLDEVGVARRDAGALDLQRRRDLAVLVVEALGQDREALDRLDAGERGVDALDLALDQRHDLGVAGEVGVGRVGDLALGGPVAHVVLVQHQQRDEVAAPVAQHDGVVDVHRRLQLVLDLLRRYVLPAGGDEDVLLAVRDAQVAVRVELADVAGAQPAVLQGRGGRGGVLVVAEEVPGAAREDLAVVGDPHLDPVERRADGAEAHVVRVDRDQARRLGEAVALADVDADAAEVGEYLGRDRGGPRDRQAHAVETESVLEG